MEPALSAKIVLPVLALALSGCITLTADYADDGYEADRPTWFTAADYAAACGPDDDWDKPAPPFRLFGGTYHVGTCGISAYLVTSPDGYLLIDGGTEKGGELVEANIRALGISPRHVVTIAHTQEHFDHVAGIAHLKDATGATLIASEVAARVFATGEADESDPQYGLASPFPAVAVDEVIADGHVVTLGGKEIVGTYTPGHSAGAMSWRWEECEEDVCHSIVFTDGMNPISRDDYRFTDHPAYLEAFRASLDWLAEVDADICLTPHPAATALFERIAEGTIVDPDECARYATLMRDKLEARVVAEGQAK